MLGLKLLSLCDENLCTMVLLRLPLEGKLSAKRTDEVE
jgi:hypothetical protein